MQGSVFNEISIFCSGTAADGNCTVPTKIALFFVERYRNKRYKPIKMNRSYIYPLIFVGTVFNMYLALQYLKLYTVKSDF